MRPTLPVWGREEMDEPAPNVVVVLLTVEVAVPPDAHGFLGTHGVDHADADAVRAAVVAETEARWGAVGCPARVAGTRTERIHAAAPWWVSA
jgi:hypothetical protein